MGLPHRQLVRSIQSSLGRSLPGALSFFHMRHNYPKVLYHRTEEPRIVNSAEEHARIGAGWAETPAAFTDEPQHAPVPFINQPAKKRQK